MWLVGKFISVHPEGICWEFQGVFDTEDLAVLACLNEYSFIAPVVLNESLPNEKEEWPGCYYPKAKIVEVK